MLRFREKDHRYEEIDNPSAKWIGVTTLINMFKEKFPDTRADDCSVKEGNPWYGISPEEIKRIWKEEADRSTSLGTWYHHMQEDIDYQNGAIQCCPVRDEWKYAGDQILTEGVHPEYILYHPEYKVCGQADRPWIAGNIANLQDYKSNKKITKRSWNGRKMMLKPVAHLEECHLSTYSLQLSMYMYFMLYHNPNLVPGKLEIIHVKFKEIGQNKYGYPIYEEDGYGGYTVQSTEIIPCRYMEREVNDILEWYKKAS